MEKDINNPNDIIELFIDNTVKGIISLYEYHNLLFLDSNEKEYIDYSTIIKKVVRENENNYKKLCDIFEKFTEIQVFAVINEKDIDNVKLIIELTINDKVLTFSNNIIESIKACNNELDTIIAYLLVRILKIISNLDKLDKLDIIDKN